MTQGRPGRLLGNIATFAAVATFVLVLGEIIIRVAAVWIVIPEIEGLRYANELAMRTDRESLPFRHRPNVEANLMGHTIRLNAFGHRSPQPEDKKPQGERRIYFLGTSMTMGWGVGQNETFSAVATRLLNERIAEGPISTYLPINAGVMNYNTVYEVALFRDQIEKLKPDIAVLQYYLRDAQMGQRERNPALLKYSMFLAFAYHRIKANFATGGVSLAQHLANLHKPESNSWRRTEKALIDLQEICEKQGIQLVAVLLPDLQNVAKDGPLEATYTRVRGNFRSLGIPLIDTLPAVRALVRDKPSAYWVHPSDPHPNAALHSLYGSAIADYLGARP